MTSPQDLVACSQCFTDEGLRLDAEKLGLDDPSPCPRCGMTNGRKLTSPGLMDLAQHYFVWGSMQKAEYGAAPIVQFNDRRKTDVDVPRALSGDVELFESVLGIGFFYYGPRLWMLGEIEPLKDLQCERSRNEVIDRILNEYRSEKLTKQTRFYRVRKDPEHPSDNGQYDSAKACCSNGRLDSSQMPVLYASPDLQTCLHECRVTAEDDLFVATLRPSRELELLNLTTLLEEPERVSEFESLDLTVNMLFLAGEHSYPISRAIARSAQRAGFDGLIYPSYFSMLRNGVKPFETTYGMSNRRIPQYKKFEDLKVSPNLGIFGRPIEDGLLDVSCINRIVLSMVNYSVHFGPVLDQP